MSDVYQRLGMKLNIDNIRELLQRLGNPQNRFRSVHIAGTNGKGSVAAMLHSILRAEGYRTGLLTSPHLVRFNERIVVDDRQISDSEVEKYFSVIEPHMKAMASQSPEKQITFFEATTAMAFLYFADKGVDYAVVEVGLGGRLDATNVLIPDLSVITSISLDHTRILGDSVEKIAGEKAGIIKPGVPVVLARNTEAVLPVIRRVCRERNSPFHYVPEELPLLSSSFSIGEARFSVGFENGPEEFVCGMGGAHQIDNAMTAISAARLLGAGFGAIKHGLADVKWPGRLEIAGRNPLLLLDACHNAGGALSLRKTLTESGISSIQFIMGFSAEGRERQILPILEPLMERLVITAADNPRALPIDDALSIAYEVVGDRVEIIRAESPAEALALAYGRDTCIAGSLYLLGDIKKEMEKTDFRSEQKFSVLHQKPFAPIQVCNLHSGPVK